MAIIDWYLKRVLSWRISNGMDTAFCIDCLEEALRSYDKPEIFNSDQGSQFTSKAFTDVLLGHGITISMDDRARTYQAVGQETPDAVYRSAMCGGAMIVDKYPRADE